jgi:NADPH:quinone reductase-like Zn-dependent oxidoreductase
VRIVRWHRFGEPREVLQIEETPPPSPGPGEVQVRLTARAIHPSDLQNVRGLYGRPPPLPAVPGNDAAGVVVGVGPGVSGWAPGDRAILLLGATHGRGTWMDEVAVPADRLVKTPPGLSDAQAGALWVNYLSVWVMLEEVLRLQRGDVLVQTAAGAARLAVMEHAAWRGLLLINVAPGGAGRGARAAGQPHVAVFPAMTWRAVRRHRGARRDRGHRRGGGPPAPKWWTPLATGAPSWSRRPHDGGRAMNVAPGPFPSGSSP